MDVVHVAVMAPILGSDLSFVTDVDASVRVLDANHAPGVERRARPTGSQTEPPDLTEAEFDEILASTDVLLVGYPVPAGLARRAPGLAWAHHTQAGVSNLVGTDLWTSSVPLTSSRGVVGATPIAEYVVAAALHFARGLHEGARQKAAGTFVRGGYGDMRSLRSSTMGIIGLGGIGQEVARLSRAIGLRVVATRRSITTPLVDTDGADLLFPADRILEVAAQSDYLAICSQLTPETQGMVDASVFSAMKPTAVLINVARGEEVVEDALIAAVSAGSIAGAVLDVYDGELAGRPPRSDLVDSPGILLTPHISTSGDTALAEPLKRLFADNLRRFLDGRPLLNLVDRERGY